MIFKMLARGLAFALVLGGSSSLAEEPLSPDPRGRGIGSMPPFDVLRLRYESQSGLGFDGSGAELDTSRYTLGGFLTKPLSLGGNWRVLPYLSYRATTLAFDDLPAGLPFDDEDLHQISLHGMFFHQVKGSPWIHGGWARASFSSDTNEIDGDDFYYDLAIGSGYKVNNRFMLGFGVVGLELGRDSRVVAGPFLSWKATNTVNLSLMGPLLTAKWEVNDDWALALRGAPYGSTWNVDDEGQSNEYDLSSYAIRLHTEHRIMDDLWLSVGVGYSFGGSFEVRDSAGDRLYKDNLDSGLSVSVGLRLRSW